MYILIKYLYTLFFKFFVLLIKFVKKKFYYDINIEQFGTKNINNLDNSVYIFIYTLHKILS